MAEAKELALALAKALDSKKARNIKMLETGPLTTLAEYFLICSASSSTQIRALCDECEKAAEELGESVHHKEGRDAGNWVLLDFSDVVVHLFLDETRKFYDLERLWSDATPVDLSTLLLPDQAE